MLKGLFGRLLLRITNPLIRTSTIRAKFIDEAGAVTAFPDHLEMILRDIAEDADQLGCEPEVARARAIVTEGTSADRQLSVFATARAGDASRVEALVAVIDWIAEKPKERLGTQLT